MPHPKLNGNVDEEKYRQRQKRYWEQLRQEFDRFKSELGVTNSELAQCLGISRQPLVSFMQNSSLGLPIQRSNLERLWDLLTDFDRLKEKKLSSEARLNREVFRRKGPDALLKAAGFLPNSDEQILDVSPTRYQQIQRVVSRLSGLPVAEPADFIRLIESIENFIARSFPVQRKLEPNSSQLSDLCMPSKELVEGWIRNNNFIHSPDSYVVDKLKRSVSHLAVSGKYDLESAEMFELYMSISENEKLYKKIDEILKMRITQCQFKTLTFLFTECKIDESLKDELSQVSFEAEEQLRIALRDTPYGKGYLKDAVSDVVMEVSIVCNFRQTNENVCWRYSSSTTHLENMFAAISYGMGCESELELVDLSIQSLGRKDYSLVKTSSVFRNIHAKECNQNGNKIYQGTWVDRSAILGLLQSVAIAVRGWLSDQFTDTEQCRKYYEACKEIAAIDDALANGRRTLSGYRLQHTEYGGSFAANYFLEKEVIAKIQELKEGLFRENPIFLSLYGTALDHKYCMAQLSCAHSSLIEGDMVKATELLVKIEDHFKKIECKNTPLEFLFSSEKVLQLLFRGDQTLFSDRNEWRSHLELSLEGLSKYIYTFRKYCGRLDYDTYMVASELFGRIGRLNFCLCGLEDVDYLEQAIPSFLKAAYCSSKIGHRQRAAHWISNASRVCSRLGYGDRAKKFSDLAADMIGQSMEPAYSQKHRESIMAEVNVSYGEHLLLIEKDFYGAMEYFLLSLKGSIYIGFSRLISDNFYNIARTSKYLVSHKVGKSFEDAFSEKKNSKSNHHDLKLDENEQGWEENRIAIEAIKFINQVDKDADWISVSEQFQQQAKKIWHDWANTENPMGTSKHPIEDELDSYRYLKRIK